ncbi:homoserine kinase [Fodinicurvata sediminis]|uniref:homoserine kinase n=1 Tax=Fodinicurvata sediminis TaxID=1121832 RepID=UPI0003B5434D|nr:homoserine kinase [Fodinicurvata sediminis]
MAVYTEVTDADLRAFLSRYDLGEILSFKGIAEGVENSNYLLQTDRGRYILTLYEKRVERSELPFFVNLMEHLAQRGIPCPTPVHSRDGETLQELNGRPAAVITFLNGLWPRRIHPFHCQEVGHHLAHLHLAGSDFEGHRRNRLSIDGWRGLLDTCRARADEVFSGLGGELESELQDLEARWPQDLPSGIIHADLFPDNVFFRDERLSGLIDFYFACNDFYAYDVATCMNAWCFESDGAFNATKARLLLAAYRKVRPFSAEELTALPLMARGSALRFLLTRLYDWLNHPPGAFVEPKDPLEYWRKLRFHRDISGPGAYGLEV